MKFYTLDFDCNAPVTQQVNVPTNTDYKIGVKFTKNGKTVSPFPENVTLGTLSADTDKTNGYVTFTKKSGDNASYVQDNLVVDEGLIGMMQLSALGLNSTGANISITQNPIFVDVPDDLVGQPLANAAEMYSLWMNSTTEMTVEEAWEGNKTTLLEKNTFQAMHTLIAKTTYNGQTVYVRVPNRLYYGQGYPYMAEWEDKVGQCVFLYADQAGQSYIGTANISDIRLSKGDKVYVCAQGSWQKNKYGYAGIQLKGGTPILGSFKLNTNIFKSQQGDLADGVQNASSAELTGKFADDTEFSYDIVVK